MFTIVACVLESQGRILFLRRAQRKSQGGLWGLPAGKIEAHETYAEAMARELREETGYRVSDAQLAEVGSFEFNKNKQGEYRIILYHLQVSDMPAVRLDTDEHEEYRWMEPQESLRMTDTVADLRPLLLACGY
jgi:mutator protein MutT